MFHRITERREPFSTRMCAFSLARFSLGKKLFLKDWIRFYRASVESGMKETQFGGAVLVPTVSGPRKQEWSMIPGSFAWKAC